MNANEVVSNKVNTYLTRKMKAVYLHWNFM